MFFEFEIGDVLLFQGGANRQKGARSKAWGQPTAECQLTSPRKWSTRLPTGESLLCIAHWPERSGGHFRHHYNPINPIQLNTIHNPQCSLSLSLSSLCKICLSQVSLMSVNHSVGPVPACHLAILATRTSAPRDLFISLWPSIFPYMLRRK